MEGQGRLTQTDGSYYECSWHSGQPVKGKWYSADGKTEYEGQFKSMLWHGFGTVHQTGVRKYMGKSVQLCSHGISLHKEANHSYAAHNVVTHCGWGGSLLNQHHTSLPALADLTQLCIVPYDSTLTYNIRCSCASTAVVMQRFFTHVQHCRILYLLPATVCMSYAIDCFSPWSQSLASTICTDCIHLHIETSCMSSKKGVCWSCSTWQPGLADSQAQICTHEYVCPVSLLFRG